MSREYRLNTRLILRRLTAWAALRRRTAENQIENAGNDGL